MKEEKFSHIRKPLCGRRLWAAEGGVSEPQRRVQPQGCGGQSGEIPTQRSGADQHSPARVTSGADQHSPALTIFLSFFLSFLSAFLPFSLSLSFFLSPSLLFWAVWMTGSWSSGRGSGLCLAGGKAEVRILVHQTPPGSM